MLIKVLRYESNIYHVGNMIVDQLIKIPTPGNFMTPIIRNYKLFKGYTND